MMVEFWGVRGSYPTPIHPDSFQLKLEEIVKLAIEQKIKIEDCHNFIQNLPLETKTIYGGNTACVSVRDEKNILIFDAGSGMITLGNQILRNSNFAKYKDKLNIFMSHTHLDHINGLPFFIPLYQQENCLNFYSIHPKLKNIFESLFHPNFHPVPFSSLKSQKEFIQLDEAKVVNIGDFKIDSIGLNHPNGSFAYRVVNQNGHKIVYATDAEYKANDYQRFVEFYKDADILIYDAQYTILDLAYKYDWGHSTPVIGVDLAVRAGVKKLLLFHHNPAYDTKQIVAGLETAKTYLKEHYPNAKLDLQIANEGMVFDF